MGIDSFQRAYRDARSTAPAQAFDDWLVDALVRPAVEHNAVLADWAHASGDAGRFAHPLGREEHLLPLHVVGAAAGDSTGRKVFGGQVMSVEISAFQFD